MEVPSPAAERLMFLHLMDLIEAEDERRGGPGRISYEEFREVVQGREEESMEFVGAWLDLAVF